MVPKVPSLNPAPPVALRVTDLAASREFFQELFGLHQAPEHPATDVSVVLTSPVPGHRHFSIKLTTDAVPVRLAGVHVELESTNDLLDLYFLALLGGYRTSELRFRRGSLSTTITDPDGYTVEVEAHHGDPGFNAVRRRPPQVADRRVPGRDAGDFAYAAEFRSTAGREVRSPERTTDRYACAPSGRAR